MTTCVCLRDLKLPNNRSCDMFEQLPVLLKAILSLFFIRKKILTNIRKIRSCVFPENLENSEAESHLNEIRAFVIATHEGLSQIAQELDILKHPYLWLMSEPLLELEELRDDLANACDPEINDLLSQIAVCCSK